MTKKGVRLTFQQNGSLYDLCHTRAHAAAAGLSSPVLPISLYFLLSTLLPLSPPQAACGMPAAPGSTSTVLGEPMKQEVEPVHGALDSW